jgi:hypothetical protein
VDRGDIDIIVSQASRKRIAPDTVAGWAQVLLAMQRDGLPVMVGTDRVEQGLAKNVPAASIHQSLTALHNQLAWGKKLVDTRLSDTVGDKSGLASRKAGIIVDLEVARRQGFNMKAVDRLLTDTRADIRDAGAIVGKMTAWSAYGLEADFVLSSFREILEAEKGMANLMQLHQLIENYVAMGASSETITRTVEEKVMRLMRGPDMFRLPGGMNSPEVGTQTPLLDLHGGAGINDSFISPTGDISGLVPGSGGGAVIDKTGGCINHGGGGMWGCGGHNGQH